MPRQLQRAILLALGAVVLSALCGRAHAQRTIYPRPGKVLIIRGAFSIFSLGMDALGEKLECCGLDAAVVPAFMASSVTAELAQRMRCRRCFPPIVIIGHSKGAYLAADCARQLQAQGIAVALLVMVDNSKRSTVPSNVRRCVNFYHTNLLGVFHGFPAQGEAGCNNVWNIDIDQLPGRPCAGYIDHFNMDGSDWIHAMIIQEVLRVCPRCCCEAAARFRDRACRRRGHSVFEHSVGVQPLGCFGVRSTLFYRLKPGLQRKPEDRKIGLPHQMSAR